MPRIPMTHPLLAVSFLVAASLPATAFANQGGSRRGDAVRPLFGLTEPADGPFPSDRFTLTDGTQNTCLRVNLPKPTNCVGQESECFELDLLNELDGFNLKPRLSVPFSGPIDLRSVNSETMFLVNVGNTLANGAPSCTTRDDEDDDDEAPERRLPGAGWVVGINQIVWDPLKNTLHVEVDEVLEQHTRYVLIVTRGLRDTSGSPIERAEKFARLRDGDERSSDPAVKAYSSALRRALAEARLAGVHREDIAVASVFTTVSGSAILEKIRDDVMSLPTPAAARFDIGNGGARTVFEPSTITRLTLNREQKVGGTLSSTGPNEFPGGRLPLLSFIPGAISKVAFGKYRSPDYMGPDATIPLFGTFSGTPATPRMVDRYFSLTIPSATPKRPKPPDGWPVIIYAHGGGDNMTASFSLAATFASHGLATLCFNQVGHGFGPNSTFTVTRSKDPPVTFPFGGRAFDLDGDGAFGASEGGLAIGQRTILLTRDAHRQNVADLVQLIRVLEAGVDVDGQNLDPSHVYLAGISLGGDLATLLATVERRIRAAVINGFSGWLRVQILDSRRTIGAYLKDRRPSLLNPAGTPIITQRGGADPAARLGFREPFFNENMPAPDSAPLVNDIPGALEIQEFLDRFEWLQSNHAPGAFTPYLKLKPLAGVPPKPVLFQMARGDRSSAANPDAAEAIIDGDLADRVMLYRHDEFEQRSAFKDPHTFLVRIDNATMMKTASAAQEQIATFFESDGATVSVPHPLFEFPANPLPKPNTAAIAPAVIGDFGFIF